MEKKTRWNSQEGGRYFLHNTFENLAGLSSTDELVLICDRTWTHLSKTKCFKWSTRQYRRFSERSLFPHLPKQNTFKLNFKAPPGRGGRWWSKGATAHFQMDPPSALPPLWRLIDVIPTRSPCWPEISDQPRLGNLFSFWTFPLCCGAMLGEHSQTAPIKVLGGPKRGQDITLWCTKGGDTIADHKTALTTFADLFLPGKEWSPDTESSN